MFADVHLFFLQTTPAGSTAVFSAFLWVMIGASLTLLVFILGFLLFGQWAPRLHLLQASLAAPSREQAVSYPGNGRRPWLLLWATGLVIVLFLFCLGTGFLALLPRSQPPEEVAATVVAQISLTATAQATPSITPTIVLPTPTPTPILLPATCAQMRARNPAAGDGEYTLFLAGDGRFPLTLYCYDMGANPREYLTLPISGGSANFALISYPEGALTTHFQKIRLDPASLVVDIGDLTFSTTQESVPGYNPVPAAELFGYPVVASSYGHAQGCNRNVTGSPPGAANINLSGTPLILAETVTFATDGVAVENPVIDISPDRRVINLSVNGRCAQIYPEIPLRLAYTFESD